VRIIVIGRSRRRDVESWIHRALIRAGHASTLVDDRRISKLFGRRVGGLWLSAAAAVRRPERIIVGKGLGLPIHALERAARRAAAVMWYRDLLVPPDPRILERARRVDTVFLTAGGQAAEFEAAGARRALFLPDGVDPVIDRPGLPSPDFECDVAFVGSGGDEYRTEFLARVGRRFHLRTWGRGWKQHAREVNWSGGPAYGDDFGRICASARVVIGVERWFGRRAPVRDYTSNRMWRVMAAGGLYLGFAAPRLRDLARDGEHCAFYDDEEHALTQLERYLGDDAARARIREAGRRFVLAHHTIDHRIENLLTGRPFRNPLHVTPP
jgi:hypothetical protein